MSNEYFTAGSIPATNSKAASAPMRSQFQRIEDAFNLLPVMTGNASKLVAVNASGTGLESTAIDALNIVTKDGAQTLTNKTISFSLNTFLGELALSHGGTGASDLAGAQLNLGIDLKADKNDAILTGAPVAPTPATGDSTGRIATTQFVAQAVVAAGGSTPSNATPLMNGAANAGVSPTVSRSDHVHPVDTSRAPAAASTAAGTSYTPNGGIAATDVQAAITELDTEKAPLASPALTGTPTAPNVSTADNSTKIANTNFVQTLLSQQPVGMQPSNNNPLMDAATASPGVGVLGARDDHVHPMDADLVAIAALSTTGVVKRTAANTWSAGALVAGDIPDISATYLKLAGGTMSGVLAMAANSTVPTAAQFDNTTKVASTAFIQRALGSFAGADTSTFSNLSASASITATHIGKLLTCGSSSGQTINLPDASALPIGASVTLYNSNPTNGGATITVAAFSGQNVIVTTAFASTMALKPGDIVTLTVTTSAAWAMSSGASELSLSRMSAFNASLTANGYQKLPSGKIIQNFSVSGAAISAAFTFPLAFPNAVQLVIATLRDSSGTLLMAPYCTNGSRTLAGATIVMNGWTTGSWTVDVEAIGY